MTISPEMLAAYADGELDQLSAARVERALGDDPDLARQLEALLALKDKLNAHFAPILDQPVPEQITAPIADAAKVVDLSAVRAARQRWFERPALRYGGGAIAAALALVLVLVMTVNRTGDGAPGMAGEELARALDSQRSGVVGPGGTKVLLSFRDHGGALCRGYAEKAGSGIACREDSGWHIRTHGANASAEQGAYRQAGSADAAVMAAAQDMAGGPALDADEEAKAIAAGWKR
ncbi:MAG: hypothetical protein KGM49_10110 [Sphingomonadales bacterium]|nr:hypothetical protein [Sphingomonadales bacterium]